MQKLKKKIENSQKFKGNSQIGGKIFQKEDFFELKNQSF